MFRREACTAEFVVGFRQPEPKIERLPAHRENSYCFVLFPGFSLLTLAAFLEPLTLANQILNRTAYRWRLIGCEGKPVQTSNGISLPVDVGIGEAKRQIADGYRPDYVFLCGGKEIVSYSTPETKAFLRFLNWRGIRLAGLGTGSWIIADAGLLQQKRCTVHWQELASFAASHPEAQVEDSLFIKDGPVHSCPGGIRIFRHGDLAGSR